MMDVRLGCLALLFCGIISYVDGCSCQFRHPHQSFCSSDYVIKARVKRITKGKEPGTSGIGEATRKLTYYNVSIDAVFKGSNIFRNATRSTLYSHGDSATCGAHLMKREKYLIMGYVSAGFPRVSLCDHVSLWSKVPKSQKRGLRAKYQKNCDCKVEVCWAPKCMRKRTSPNACRWNPREDTGNCFGEHGFCKRRPNGKCKWSKPNVLKGCLADVEAKKGKEP